MYYFAFTDKKTIGCLCDYLDFDLNSHTDLLVEFDNASKFIEFINEYFKFIPKQKFFELIEGEKK